MKKLKTWQIVLMIIIYPVGIAYLIYRLCKKNKAKADPNVAYFDASKATVLRDFHTKVAGVTFKNDDGTSRQDIIRTLSVGSDVVFRPVEIKGHPEAIAVYSNTGKQIGFLNAYLAEEMRDRYAQNPMSVVISSISGGEDDKSLGCNLHIVIYEKQ